mmetsp:Transcript_24102/g.36517  ORF Transcript_24102/g.36517 Transcript_24102/m.36517 type:complete len:114 (-) Transcript_24102:56-397(-)
MEMHIQGVAAAVLQEVLLTHLLIAAHSHHQQVEGSDMTALLMLLLYHQGRRVKSFTNINETGKCELNAQHHNMKRVDILKQDVHSSYESPFKEGPWKQTIRLSYELPLEYSVI